MGLLLGATGLSGPRVRVGRAALLTVVGLGKSLGDPLECMGEKCPAALAGESSNRWLETERALITSLAALPLW